MLFSLIWKPLQSLFGNPETLSNGLMFNGRRILAVIPARGGSKGIPRKNIRLLGGKPLIAYSIESARNSKYIDDVVLSSDDEEILETAKLYGATIIQRPDELAADDVPLDPVIHHALVSTEIDKGVSYDYIVSMQPTSPLLKSKTLDGAISKLIEDGSDTLIGVRDETHLYWTKKGDVFSPLYIDRLNRQDLDPIFKETGFFISAKRFVTKGSRIGGELCMHELPYEESIDIDTNMDWLLVEYLLKKLVVVIRTDADNKLGLGHIYRGITLANRIFDDVYFFMSENKRLGIKKVSEYNHKIITYKDRVDFIDKLLEIKPNIIINDILDTTYDDMIELKNLGFFIVSFEDLGDGALNADLTFNALYERSDSPKNSYFGYKYVCLRDEFFIYQKKEIESQVREVLILFGGSDPNDLTTRTLKAMELLKLKNITINIIIGLGYEYVDRLSYYINNLNKKGYDVRLNKNVKTVAKHISNADVAITSNGRTVYEITAMEVPCISISQNEREMRHLFSYLCRGVKNLGIESNVTIENISLTINELISNYDLRKNMSQYMAEFNLKKGTDRVMRLIFDKYWEKQENEEN